MPPYHYTGPVGCDQELNCSVLQGKTAIVTGGNEPNAPYTRIIQIANIRIGANGLGEAYVRALVAAG
jgi:NAD(P)-dependent dehydrogenase (short-subunit alcohol dehydrogenase family)